MTRVVDRRTLIAGSAATPGIAAAGTVLRPAAGDASFISDEGAIDVAGFRLPPSGHLQPSSRQLFIDQARQWQAIMAEQASLAARGASAKELRARYSQALQPTLRKQQRRYNVRARNERLGGIAVQIFEPHGASQGEAVLINVHGGGFNVGSGLSAAIESIPIAAVSGLRVVSVDYRMAPEHVYPAATEDVVAVYRALLKAHEPGRIGVFGSSAAPCWPRSSCPLCQIWICRGPAALGCSGRARPGAPSATPCASSRQSTVCRAGERSGRTLAGFRQAIGTHSPRSRLGPSHSSRRLC